MRRFEIHPFFVVDLLQMCRYGQYQQAADMAAREVLIAVRDRVQGGGTDGTDGGNPGGVVMLPTPQRQSDLGYPTPDSSNDTEQYDVPRL